MDAHGLSDQEIFVGIRPEGFIPDENGPLSCKLSGVEVMGRDISVVSTHPACENTAIRAIISSDTPVNTASENVRFSIKPGKIFIFSRQSQERISF